MGNRHLSLGSYVRTSALVLIAIASVSAITEIAFSPPSNAATRSITSFGEYDWESGDPGYVREIEVVSKTETSIALRWRAPITSGSSVLTGYSIQYQDQSSANLSDPASWSSLEVSGGSTTTATLTGLVKGRQYSIKVAAVNVSGIGPYSKLTNSMISVGNSHSCFLQKNNGVIKCWGENDYGQLGNNSRVNQNVPVSVEGISDAIAVDAGGDWNTCAILKSGQVKCWGGNAYGIDGKPRNTVQFTGVPNLISNLSDVIDISIGTHASCAVEATGVVKCWGSNYYGALGSPLVDSTHIPVTVSGIDNAVEVSVGIEHACAVLSDGFVKCWGTDGEGQLGNGNASGSSRTPTLVSGISTAVQLDVGGRQSCAALLNGTVSCWGELQSNSWPSYVRRVHTPEVAPNLTGAVNVSVGLYHICASTDSGQTYCWGNNGSGRLGTNSGGTARSLNPVLVELTSKTQAVVSGNGHSCSLTFDGKMSCWGSNSKGQLSSGTFSAQEPPSLSSFAPTQFNPFSAVVPAAPAAPELVSRTVTSATITLSTLNDGGRPVVGYEARYSVDSGASWVISPSVFEPLVSANVSGLTMGERYIFQVRAISSEGTGEWSLSSNQILIAGTPGIVSVGHNSNTVSSSSITVVVNSTNTNGSAITDYIAQYTSDSGLNWTTFEDGVSSNTEIVVTGLTKGATYRFRVLGINEIGTGAASSNTDPIIAASVPAAPVNIVINSRSSTSTNISFEAPDNGGLAITTYSFRKSLDNGVSWVSVGDLTRISSTSTTVTIQALATGETHLFQVRAESARGVGAWSTSSSPALAASIPSTPSAPTISSKTATSLAIAWNAPNANGSAISDYIIESSSNNGSSWSTLSESVSTERTAELVGLTRGSTYLIRVTAVNGEGNSVASSSLSAIPAVKPLAPTNIVVNSRTTTSISISWTAPDNGGRAITGYYIQRSTDAGANWASILLTPNDQAAFFNQSLSTGVSYYYRVAAKTPEVSNESAAVFSTISPAALTATAPSVATAPAVVSKNATSASVSWTAPIANGSAITGLTIEASSDSFSTIAASQNYSSTSTTHNFVGLTRGTTYQIRLKATNGEGTTTSPTVTVIPAVKPLAPTNIVSTERTINAVAISWDAPSDDGGRAITGYVVQRSTNLSTWTAVTTLASDARTFRNGSLTSNVVYYYRVAALSPEATSATTAVFSSPSSGARTSILPFAPNNLAAAVQSGTSVSLAWASGGNPGAPVTDYVIERSDDSGQTWTGINDGTDAYLGKTITGLTQGTAYLFRVSAVNLEGAGPATTLSSAIIPAATPSVASAPTVISQSSTAIGISWDAPYDGGRDITSYTVQVSANAGVTWATAANLTRASVTALEATVGGLTQGSTYQFRISATNAMGTSGYSLASSPAKAATTPGPVSNFRQTANENNSITVSWASAFSNGSDLTKYEVDYSRNGVDWTTVEAAGNANTIRIAGLTASAAYELRIRAVNLQGVGAYVQTEGATRGTTAQSISVLAANGEPVTGGSITWALNDGRARSSSGLPLNSSGLARFSLVATGLATVTIEDGLLSSGATVDGTWQVTFGFGSVELELPEEPLLTTKALEVSMPNGVKVPDAFVSTLSGFYSGMYVSGFSFYAPSPGISGYTDKEGMRTLVGYSVGDPVAVITYDDSVLSQTIDVILSEQNTEVELPLMPWVTAPEVNKNIVAGEADTVLFTANAIPEIEVMTLSSSDELNQDVTASSVSTLAFEPGVRVTVVPPVGAESSPYGCTQILSALTDANGVATLKICPSISGEYKVVTAGAVASKPLIYNVLGRPSPAIIPAAPSQNSAPVAAPAPAAIAEKAKLTMRLKQKTAGATLATQIGMTVTPKAKVKLTVAKASKKFCKVSGGKLVALKPGNCSVTVSVTPAKTKQVKKPKATKQSTVVAIS